LELLPIWKGGRLNGLPADEQLCPV
jgi:hypothetical protein